MLSFGQSVRGAMVRGILPDEEEKVADFRAHIKEGSLDSLQPDAFNIVLGSELARALGVLPGDKVTVIAPQAWWPGRRGAAPEDLHGQRPVRGRHVREYDSALALIRLEDAQKLYRMGDRVSGVRLKLDDLFRAPWVVRQLANTLTVPAYISDWTRSHANFFRAVQIGKNMMFIILSLIVAVAAFNIVSTLVMAVTDKQADMPSPSLRSV